MTLETAPTNSAFTRNHTEEVTIADEGTTSDEFIVGGRGVVTIHLPAMDACYISYLVKINPGDTAVVLVDDSNSTLTFPRGASATVTTARVYQEPRLSGVYSVQLVASAAQNGGPRTIGISARGQNPIPTVTDIEATIVSGATVTANQGTQGSAASPWFVQPEGTNSVALLPNSAAAADTFTNPTTTNIMAMIMGWNGATFDRVRNNIAGTLLASAARTTATSSADQTNYNGQAVTVTFNITVVPGIETLTLTIEAKDPVSGAYTVIATGAAQVATGTTRVSVGPAIASVANLQFQAVVGRTWRATVTPSAAGSFTYSLGYDVMTA